MANNILKLSVETSEYDAKLKKAAEGIRHLADVAHKSGGDLTGLEKAELEYIKALGEMETQSRSAAGKTRELGSAFKELTVIYNQLNEYEKADEGGKALRASLDQLKERAKEAKVELEKAGQELNGSKFGEFGSVLDTIGKKMGITGNLTQMLTSETALMTTGIGMATAAVYKATDAWAAYNTELGKQDQITQVTTGLQGEDANKMTDFARALVDTYNVDFREAINSANILMTQFGQTSDNAMNLLRDGMQGMITGDGPKMLSMIQQFAPAFRDAGLSASQLVAIIHNSEGGLFSEQNMNAILMGIKNIRLMTNNTSEALAQLGIDGEEMSRKMADGSMTVFQALHQVAEAIENTKAGSKEAGEVMQYVFGRQGAMQGMKLGRAIAELNTNLEKTKTQTGELGEAYKDLQKANEDLAAAIRECFSYDGWNVMATEIKTNLISALTNVVGVLGDIRKLLTGESLSVADSLQKKIDNLRNNKGNQQGGIVQGRYVEVTDANGNVISGTHYDVDANGNVISGTHYDVDANGNVISSTHYDVDANGNVIIKPLPGHKPTVLSGGSHTGQTYMEGSLSAQQALVSELTKKWHDASGEIKDGYLTQLVAAQSILAKMKDDDALAMWGAAYNMRKGNLDLEMSSGDRLSFWGADKSFNKWIKEKGDNTNFTGFSAKAQNAIDRDIRKQLKGEGEKKSFVEVADQINGGVSQMVSSLQQIGIDIPDGFQSVLGSLSGVIGLMQAIITVVEGAKAMSTVGSFLGSILGFQNGSIVPHAANGYLVGGNNYSGDTTPILANAGELVLSRSQQGVLASALEGNGAQNLQLEAVVTGEQIRFVLNNNGRRTGRGEYVQSNYRRS